MAHRKAKRPYTLLRGYSMLLEGISELEILKKSVRMDELAKIQRFHEAIVQNRNYITVAHQINIDLKLAKRLSNLYDQYAKGEPVSYRPKRTKTTYAFTLLLDGFSDSEILEKRVTESDIDSAKKFLEIAPVGDTMLHATIAKKLGFSRETVVKMLKIWREKQAEMTMEDMHEKIPVFA